ncbi:peptidylprolyl isomerase [bacterium]|nr:peptidylprolyl isomerase [candidate division CSSED10-310 bacterium]
MSTLKFVLIIMVVAATGMVRAEDTILNATETQVETSEAAAIAPVADSASTAHDPNRIVAKINGQPIYFHEVEKRVDNFEKKFQEVNPAMKLPEEKRISMRKDFLDRMVRERIMEQAAESGHFTVTDEEINERINQLQKIFGEGEEAKARFLSGITDMNDFRNNIAKQIRIDKYIESIQKNLTVDITDQEISDFYSQNADRFKKEESVDIQQIVWRLPPKEDAGYQEKLTGSLAKAESLMKEAQSGRDFSELVKAFSEDQKMAEKEGKVGWVERKQLIKPLEDAVFNLSVGEVSKPIQTDLGIFVIKALGKEESRIIPLEEVREKIREGLLRNKVGQSREKIYEDLKTKASIEILL